MYLFFEGGKERQKERERYIDRLPLAGPQPGTWPETPSYALTGYQTCDLLVCGMTFNPLSPTSQGSAGCFHNILHSIQVRCGYSSYP